MLQSSRSLLAVGLLLVLAVAAIFAIAWPVSRSMSIQQDLEAMRGRLAAVRQANKTGQGAEDFATADLLIPGESTGRAAADLQNRLGAVARRHAIPIRSAHAIETKRQGELNEIAVAIAFQANSADFLGLLHEIETGVPLLIIDELQVRSQAPVAGPARMPIQLDVTMKVRGFSPSQKGR